MSGGRGSQKASLGRGIIGTLVFTGLWSADLRGTGARSETEKSWEAPAGWQVGAGVVWVRCIGVVVGSSPVIDRHLCSS